MKENEGKKQAEKYKYKAFGDRMNEAMFRRNMSNKELARLMYVSPSAISGYRTGRRSPAVTEVAAIATFLHVSTDYLFGFTDVL